MVPQEPAACCNKTKHSFVFDLRNHMMVPQEPSVSLHKIITFFNVCFQEPNHGSARTISFMQYKNAFCSVWSQEPYDGSAGTMSF